MPGDFDLVKERVDLVQLIGERVALRRAGRAYVGLCPFHAEKTPSFNVDPERRTYKCFGCLPPGSLIKTVSGPRAIEQIAAGDEVYAGDGRPHRVLQLHEHDYDGDLVKLICAPFKIPVVLTPDHKVPVLRPRSRRPEQIEAGLIRPQNYLIYPAIQRAAARLDWSPRAEWFSGRGRQPKPLPSAVDTSLLAEWLGWYLAEGSVSQDRTIHFSLAGDEGSVAERLTVLTSQLFGESLRRRDRSEHHSIELWFCHALLVRWLKHECGSGARNKRLPDFVWGWNGGDQWTLIRALAIGDARLSRGGYVARYGYTAGPSWSLGLVSARLIDDIRDLLIANGVVPKLTEEMQVDGRRCWRVTTAGDIAAFAEHSPVEPIAVRVRRVERSHYSGRVYNLTVDKEHTYLTLSGTVCNCGEGGDAFTWLEKQDGLEPVEALRVLAERAGVELTRRAPEEREHEKKLLAAHETAHFYFRQALRGTPAGKAAAEYIAKRGITTETVEKFGLGYAPDIRDGLLGYLTKKGFSEDEAVATGLAIDHERGRFDRFRDRLMIPIRDGKGRVIAFAGRAMRAGQPAKYMNSPATELFDKSATLFALDVARGPIRRKSEAVIVEGQFDAIACHQAGFDNVVASMGTALTQEQYRVLDRLKIESGPGEGRAGGRIVVAFDGDAPGQASAEKRGRELATIVRREVTRTIATRTSPGVYVALLPPATDPDDLARSDPERLRATLAAAEPVLAFVIAQIQKRSDLVSPDGRRRFLAETLPLLVDEPDPLTRELYLGTLSRLTGVPEEALREQMAGVRREARPAAGTAGTAPGVPAGPATGGADAERGGQERNVATERYLMAQLIQFPDEATRLDLDPTDLADPDHRAIYSLLRKGERPGPSYPAPLAAVVAALGAEAPSPEDADRAVRGIEMAVQRVRAENVRRRMREVRVALNRGTGEVSVLMDDLAKLTEELTGLMRAQERDTVLRSAAENEDE